MWYRFAKKHTGIMIALALPETLARSIAIPSRNPHDGCDPESWRDLHLTLAFLGTASEQEENRDLITRIVRAVSKNSAPIRGRVSGLGRFNNDTGGDKHALYASFDAPDLTKFREEMVSRLKDADLPVSDLHGFTPHITLAYLDASSPTPDILPKSETVTLGRLLLAWGGEHTYFDLDGA